uniref:RING finger protein n=1 Tax=Ascaris suum TaxID=6253 RepID=F1LE27_ASCSU
MDSDNLQCGVCFDTMVKPMILRCGHSFCELCAEESINFSDKCPLCRQKSVGICIFNRSLDQCIQSWMSTQDKSIKEAYRQRVAQYSKILLLKNRARIILWTVISRSKNDGVKIDDVEKLYNEIQREWGRETVEFDADLKEQIRRRSTSARWLFLQAIQG